MTDPFNQVVYQVALRTFLLASSPEEAAEEGRFQLSRLLGTNRGDVEVEKVIVDDEEEDD